jgi:DNA-binding FadR family transcriptional regulator
MANVKAARASAFEMSSPAENPHQQRSSKDAHRDIAEAIRARNADAAAAAVDFVILDGLGRITV